MLWLASTISCTTRNEYEPFIKEYAQTDISGVMTDKNFKAVNIEVQNPIKVSDSLMILKEKFDRERREDLNRLAESLKKTKEGLEREKMSGIKSKSIIRMYTQYINEVDEKLQEVTSRKFENIYYKESPDKVLLIPIKCRHSYLSTPDDCIEERTDLFYFAPDVRKIVMQADMFEMDDK